MSKTSEALQRGFGAQKTISSYSFGRIVLIFGYIVERTNTKNYLEPFFCNFHLTPTYSFCSYPPFMALNGL